MTWILGHKSDIAALAGIMPPIRRLTAALALRSNLSARFDRDLVSQIDSSWGIPGNSASFEFFDHTGSSDRLCHQTSVRNQRLSKNPGKRM